MKFLHAFFVCLLVTSFNIHAVPNRAYVTDAGIATGKVAVIDTTTNTRLPDVVGFLYFQEQLLLLQTENLHM